MPWLEIFGYAGAVFTVGTFSMKTMLHLRMVGICANVSFITYGVMGAVYPILFLHLTLLPLNVWRLRQLLRLTRQIAEASSSGLSVDWLKPFSRSRTVSTGEVLFRAGDAAGEVLFALSGQYRAVEAGVVLGSGEVFGELGLVLKDQRRTQTVVCEQAGTVLQITYDEVRQMYFQNPRFGFYFLHLAAERLARDARHAARHSGGAASDSGGGTAAAAA